MEHATYEPRAIVNLAEATISEMAQRAMALTALKVLAATAEIALFRLDQTAKAAAVFTRVMGQSAIPIHAHYLSVVVDFLLMTVLDGYS